MKPLAITVVDRSGDYRAIRFETEALAISYLTATHATEAVVSFTYVDGSHLKQEVMNAIFQQVFGRLNLVPV